jgi:hypothetical protein
MAVVTCNDKKKMCGKYRCKFQDLTLTAIDPSDPQTLQKYTGLHNAKRRFAQRCVLWNRSTPVYRGGEKTHRKHFCSKRSSPEKTLGIRFQAFTIPSPLDRSTNTNITSFHNTTKIPRRLSDRKLPLQQKLAPSVSAFIKQKQAQEAFSHQGLPPPTIMQHKPLTFFNRKCNNNVTNLEE